MLLIRAILLWSIISLHVVGGASVFRRLFPKESPWFGFLVPCLALVLVMNFTEHIVAIPVLLWLLPCTTGLGIWFIFDPAVNWRGLRLPTGIFLGSFAFTLTLRALIPDITGTRDGIPDLGLVSSFCMGDKLPPPISWYPDLLLSHYYVLGHYAISVLIRLFGLDIGSGFNLSSALLSALDCLLAAAAAWRISRQKMWITILAPILMEGAATGVTAYLWLTTKNFNPNEADDIFSGMDDSNNQSSLLKLLHDGCRNELMPPGAWSWAGSFHSTCAGEFLILFFVWSMLEVLRARTTNWPWLCLGAIPLLTIVSSTWALPLEALLLLGTLYWVWTYRLAPQSFRFVSLGVGLVAVFLSPLLFEFLTTAVGWGVVRTDPNCHTQLAEFGLMWWPLYLPLLALIFVWPKLSPGLKTILVCVPIAFLGAEYYTVANRYDWTGKMWCYIFSCGWITLIPALCARRAIVFRSLTVLVACSSLCSFAAWSSFVWHNNAWNDGDMLHLEGTGPFRWDPVHGELLLTLSRIQRQTILTSKPEARYTASPPLAAFSGNRIYVAWWGFVDTLLTGVEQPMAEHAAQEANEIYDGTSKNPLLFLRNHDISALVIYPEDHISTQVIEDLKKKLSPFYDYVDCHMDTTNAGIFFFKPETMTLTPEAVSRLTGSGADASAIPAARGDPTPAAP